MSATRYWSSVALLALAVLLGSGPRAVAGDDIAAVKGKVRLDGKPLAGGRIIFHQADGQFVGAKINKDAMFKVDRVPLGPHTITVEFKGLPDLYASEDQSPLRVEVKKGANELIIELRSK